MNKMKEIRMKKCLKQVDVAMETGLTKASISYFERGVKTPSMNSAYKIAKVLDTTIDELFFFTDEKEAN